MSEVPSPDRPLPRPTALSQPFWDACREERLLVQRCTKCGSHIFIPQPLCTECQRRELSWVESSGRGTLYSWTEIHRPQQPAFTDIPYTAAIVELEEGWFMLSNLIECSPDDRRIGMPLEVSFQRMSDEITLPMFRPAR